MTTQPAGEHHTGTLNLAGQGNPGEVFSDDLIVEATKAQHQLTDDEWHGMSDSAREYASTGVRRGLEAAYPVIRQQVAEQIAAAIEGQMVGLLDGFQARSAAAAAAREIGGARANDRPYQLHNGDHERVDCSTEHCGLQPVSDPGEGV